MYVIRVLRFLSEVTNEKYVENSLKIKKINSQTVQKLIIDFGEIKQALFAIGIKNGEAISNIYNSVCAKHCEKTEGILKILEEENDKVEGVIGEYLSCLTSADIQKILLFKGLKKADINLILSRYSLNN